MDISILILAAGNASRMGRLKQLLPYANSTLLEYIIENALASKANKVYCVLGANSDRIKNQIETSEVTFIDNKYWKEGLSSSIVAGITCLQSMKNIPDAVLIMLADQPFVDFNFIDSLIDKYQKNKESIVASNLQR